MWGAISANFVVSLQVQNLHAILFNYIVGSYADCIAINYMPFHSRSQSPTAKEV